MNTTRSYRVLLRHLRRKSLPLFPRENTMDTTPKPWWQSKTIMIAVIQMIFAVILQIEPYLGDNSQIASYVLMVKSGLDFVLRIITGKPIANNSKTP